MPLRAVEGGVLRRAGHTEAAVDLAKLADLSPAGALCELVNDDGTMMRADDCRAFSDTHGLVMISIADLIRYRRRTEKQVQLIEARKVRDDLSRQIKALGREDVLEQRARELGMVRPGETPYAVRGITKAAPPAKAPVDDSTGVWGFVSGLLG